VFALSDDQPELLQDVYVAGYPFGNEISSSIKVTKGIISSLTGIGNNFSNIQIDAALQVGNSGGPILDEMGNVVGVAVSKLDAKYMYDNFGTIPENTNFGIKANVVRSVLDSNGVSSPSPSTDEITKSELGTRITGGTYYVSCLMTLAQIEVLRTKKVMFENLD
jgi:S1-C subfamily serine protease